MAIFKRSKSDEPEQAPEMEASEAHLAQDAEDQQEVIVEPQVFEEPLVEADDIEVVEFSTVRKGYDPVEVQDKLNEIEVRHEHEVEEIAERLIAAQREKADVERDLALRIEELETARDHARAQADELELRLERLGDIAGPADSDEVAALRARVEGLEAELAGAADAVAERDETLEQVLEQLQAAQAAVERMAELEREVEQLQAELAARGQEDGGDVDERVSALQIELDSARVELRDAQARADDLDAEVARLLADREGEMDAEHEAEIEAMAARLTEAQRDAAQAAEHLAEREAELSEARGERDEARAEVEGLRGSADDVVREATEREAEARAAAERAEAARDAESRQVERYAHELEAMRAEYSTAVREAAQASAQVEVLQSELASLREQKADFGSTAEKMMAALQAVREQQERELADERKAAEVEVEELRDRARQDAERIHTEALVAAERAQSERARRDEQVAEQAREAIAELGRQAEAFEASLSERVAVAEQQERELRGAAAQAVALEVEALKAERDGLAGEIAELEQRRETLTGELRRLGVSVEALLADVPAAEPAADVATFDEQPVADGLAFEAPVLDNAVTDEQVDEVAPLAAEVEIDEVELEAPQAEKAPQVDEVELEAPQVDEVEPEAPQVDEVELEAPQVDEVEPEAPQVDEVELEAPQVDEVELEAPQVTPESDTPTFAAPELQVPQFDAPEAMFQAPDLSAPAASDPVDAAAPADMPVVLDGQELSFVDSDVDLPEVEVNLHDDTQAPAAAPETVDEDERPSLAELAQLVAPEKLRGTPGDIIAAPEPADERPSLSFDSYRDGEGPQIFEEK